jgi:hypothetical protein
MRGKFYYPRDIADSKVPMELSRLPECRMWNADLKIGSTMFNNYYAQLCIIIIYWGTANDGGLYR